MKDAFVISTLVRADMLGSCLESIARHDADSKVWVVNNWSHRGVSECCKDFAKRHEVVVLDHPENLGLAGSWNRALEEVFAAGHEWAIVMHDDAGITAGCVEKLADALSEGADIALSSAGWACFAIRRRVFDHVGPFDHNFWPRGLEAEDMVHRARLGGLSVARVEEAVAHHAGGATRVYSDLLAFQFRSSFDQKNAIFYARKWGGKPGKEAFTSPFNDARNRPSFIVDPLPRSFGLKLDGDDRVVLASDRRVGVRLYGPLLGNGSFHRVARGLSEGLAELGVLEGVADMDSFDSADIHEAPGRGAMLGLYVGNPTHAAVTMSGGHDAAFSVLAPNSSWLPARLLKDLAACSTIVSPSAWGAEVIARHGYPKMPPLRHGVSRKFSVLPKAHENLERAFDAGEFAVLHLSSSDRDRKGTRELLEAWQRLARAGKLGPRPVLLAFVDVPAGTFAQAEADPTIRLSTLRIDAGESEMALIYQSCHLVCQPSRGEGFGMCPLEARACGVPVVATATTGHSDHMSPQPAGCVVVATGDDSPINDGPGALAPSLSVEAVEAALEEAYKSWRELHRAALEAAPAVAEEWSWANQTKRWLKDMELWRNG